MGTLKKMARRIAERRDDDRGASLVEYALLIALIAVVCIAAVTMLGNNSSSKFSEFGTCWDWAGSGGSPPAECQ